MVVLICEALFSHPVDSYYSLHDIYTYIVNAKLSKYHNLTAKQALNCAQTLRIHTVLINCYLHGQYPQVTVLYSDPTQGFPPLAGIGLSQFLLNNCIPFPPQGIEQFDTANQGDQPPSTEQYGIYNDALLKRRYVYNMEHMKLHLNAYVINNPIST